MAAKTIAFFRSTVTPAHALAPPSISYAPGGHVSYPNSPGFGTVWKIHRTFPLFTSNARMWPGDPGSVSGTLLPMISRSSKIAPGVLALTVRRSAG